VFEESFGSGGRTLEGEGFERLSSLGHISRRVNGGVVEEIFGSGGCTLWGEGFERRSSLTHLQEIVCRGVFEEILASGGTYIARRRLVEELCVMFETL
jgi:hypothetical protein